MAETVAALPASADVVDWADWVELTAIQSADGNCSVHDAMKIIRRSGTVDAVVADRLVDESDQDDLDVEDFIDKQGEATESLVDAVWEEIEDRLLACGGPGNLTLYPFVASERLLQSDDPVAAPYTFMLLLSRFGNAKPKDAAGKQINGQRLFEDISSHAAKVYFGGNHVDVALYQFGFPRRVKAPGFEKALDDLCHQLGEGGGTKRRPTLADQKDAKLDLAVWRRFPDRRPGQLIGFGQCATGKNWSEKLTELMPRAFIQTWMRSGYVVHEPVRLFFLPFRISRDAWEPSANHGGVLFDRCRVALLLEDLCDDLREQCKAWSAAMIARHLQR